MRYFTMALSNSPGESLKTIPPSPEAELGRLAAALRQENAELADLLASAQIPILVVDKDMRLRRFTPAAESAFDLRPSDAGKPLTSFPLALQLPDLRNEIAKVLDGLQAAAMEVQDRQGRWYDLCIRPHRTGENAIDGVTLSLIDRTETRSRSLALESGNAYAEAALGSFDLSTAILDPALTIIVANKRFCESFRISPAKAVGRKLFQLGNGMWKRASLRDQLAALTREERPFDYEGELPVPQSGPRTLAIRGRVVPRRAGSEKTLLIAFEDVTLSKRAAESAADLKSERRPARVRRQRLA